MNEDEFLTDKGCMRNVEERRGCGRPGTSWRDMVRECLGEGRIAWEDIMLSSGESFSCCHLG